MSRAVRAARPAAPARYQLFGVDPNQPEVAPPFVEEPHRRLGDVIVTVPPQLQGGLSLPQGRSSSLVVNPAAVNGTAVTTTAPGVAAIYGAANTGGGAGTKGLFLGNSAGILEFRNITPGSGVTFAVGTSGDIIISASGGGGSAFVQGGNAFGAPAVLGTTDGHTLALIAGTAGQTAVTFSAAATPVATFSAGILSGISGTSTGSFGLRSSAGGGTFTQEASVSSTPTTYTVYWPPAVASSAGSYLVSDTSGNLSWTTSSSGSAFVQGGNAFGAPAVLGTADGNTLALIAGSSGQTAVTFSAAAAPVATFNNGILSGVSGTSTGSLGLRSSAGGGTFTQEASVSSTPTTYTVFWPPAVASSTGSYLVSDTGGNLSWTTSGGALGSGAIGNTSNQTIAAPQATYPLNMTTVIATGTGSVSTSVSGQMTLSATGKYLISVIISVSAQATGATGNAAGVLTINGSHIYYLGGAGIPTANTVQTANVSYSFLYAATAGTILTLGLDNTSGVALTVTGSAAIPTSLSAVQVG